MSINNDFNNKLTVVLRTVGERTTALCYALIAKQVSTNNIIVVREVPLANAVKKTFLAGLQAARKWTFVVDADVLLIPGAIEIIVEYVDSIDDNVFKVEGKILDKFLDSPRAGTRIYRTAMLEEAIDLIPKPVEAIRPDTHVRNLMDKKGYIYKKTEILIGFHDFEQYYRDIYRKAFVQAKKHQERTARVLSQWQELSINDDDFLVAMKGFADGSSFSGSVAIDAESDYLNAFEKVLNELGLNEKEQLSETDFESIMPVILGDIASSMKVKERYIAETVDALKKISESKSYKIGRIILAPLRAIMGYSNKDNGRVH